MSNKVTVTAHSVSFPGLLAIAFIVLKLLGHITWSWWWVLSPLWIPAGLLLIIFLIIVLFVVIGNAVS